MITEYLHCLLALAEARDPSEAAVACGLSDEQFRQALDAIERQLGISLFTPGHTGPQLSSQGERVLAWARWQVAETSALLDDLRVIRKETALAPLMERRSVSPRRLSGPGPDSADIELIIQAALRSPDHGSLRPWRVVEFRDEQRTALADLFEQEKLRRDPLASAGDRQRARAHAVRPPVLLAFVVSPRERGRVPVREQWLTAGAALGNLLNAAHQLGFGAIVLSGDRCYDETLSAQLGIGPSEYLAGFISLGNVAETPPARKPALPGEVWSCWMPARQTHNDEHHE
ncbi:nitroreductase family protein [Paucibacter sp. R3-3]|uniref:Nitroreductase family protein n=1 Tax=Roseateles agri TaxID=3098619 RepID=A0ABU5DEE4_9BURK|nr:nitroreductase family protein [Paucibacter sp. R3-3]MDY0744650.1 nitroreductase family protein [Paucibacter sp. R3-3]